MIGIPYNAVDRPGGHSNYGYVDLKRNPEKIHEIYELKDTSPLKALVKELNRERSIFRSLAVEKALGESNPSRFWDENDLVCKNLLRDSRVEF